jgi:tetratricopeptide (TPR) repeat protein
MRTKAAKKYIWASPTTMSKKRAKSTQQKSIPPADPKKERTLLYVMLGVSYAIYVAWGLLSSSTWDDDCATRYFRTLNAFRDAREFVYLWNRPLFVTIFCIPVALLGKIAIPLVMSAISVAGAYFLYLSARLYQFRYALLVIPFLLFQPYFLGTGRDAMTEPMGATIIACGIYAALSKRWLLFSMLGALLPLARTELAVLLPIWAYVLMREKQLKYILILAAGVVLWNIAGWLIMGDPLFLYHETFGRADEENRYGSQKFITYFERYFYVVGPVVFYFFLLGLYDTIRRRDFKPLIIVQFAIGFLVYTLLAWKITIGQSAGFLRNLIPLSPLVAMVALSGYNYYADIVHKKKRMLFLLMACFVLGAVIIFLYPYKIDMHHIISRKKEVDYLNIGMVAGLSILLSIGAVLYKWMDERRLRWLAAFLGIITAAFALVMEPPDANMNSEREMMSRVVEVYQDCGLESAPRTLCSHLWFHWVGDYVPFREGSKYLPMQLDSLKAAPYESVIIWESHYSNRLGNNITLNDLSDPNAYVLIGNFYPEDATKVAYMYIKKSPGKTAMQYLDDLIAKNPHAPELLVQRANLHQTAGNNAKALEDLNASVNINSKSNVARLNYANFSLRYGMNQEAISQADQILKNDPDFLSAYNIKGNAYFNASQFPQAIREFNHILEFDKDNKEAHYNIGVAYLRLNNKEEACKSLMTAKNLNMENADKLVAQHCK